MGRSGELRPFFRMDSMFIPSLDSVLDVMRRHGYQIWYSNNILNLIGIRKSRHVSDAFEDTFVCLRHEMDRWSLWSWECTTSPGRSQLEFGLEKGTAIVKPGQYIDAWSLGLHKGKYEALVQKNPITVYRDRNKDFYLDYVHEDTGLFGINIHRANAKITSKIVGNWSAGCQVLANPKHFSQLMNLARQQHSSGFPRFSYTLLEIGDFDE